MKLRQRIVPLLLFVAVVEVVAVLLDHRPSSNLFDEWLLFSAAVIGAVSLVIMVVRTDDWTVRALGVLGYIASVIALYGLSSSIAIWHWHTITQRDVDQIRALLLVGVALWGYANLIYVREEIQRWRKRRNP